MAMCPIYESNWKCPLIEKGIYGLETETWQSNNGKGSQSTETVTYRVYVISISRPQSVRCVCYKFWNYKNLIHGTLSDESMKNIKSDLFKPRRGRVKCNPIMRTKENAIYSQNDLDNRVYYAYISASECYLLKYK